MDVFSTTAEFRAHSVYKLPGIKEMKIRKVTPELYVKSSALLLQTFPNSNDEVQLVEDFHTHETEIHEWVCIHVNKVIAYIAFSNAYNGNEVCGLHLAPLAVKPEFQGQGVASELMRFALRQKSIKASTLFVLGDVTFYKKFGFTPCTYPICPFDKNNAHFLSMRNTASTKFTVGYESEFSIMPKHNRRK